VVPPDDPDLPPLTDSREALLDIGGSYGPHTVFLTGESFTKERLLAQPLGSFRFLHFATHGWLDADDPRRHGLRLTPAEDGASSLLHVHDVQGMQLAAELVVLAACRSGLGEQLQGEGLVGLTRAFLGAGARSLVVSLWNVSDRSSAEFMRAFYRYLQEGRSAPAALRLTKREFLASDRPTSRQPYRWAPFVLVGDPVLDREPWAARATRVGGEAP
jgi:CHAT domain-containing protein